jgi:hypothetical protein
VLGSIRNWVVTRSAAASLLRVEPVADAVGQHVEAQDGGEDRKGRLQSVGNIKALIGAPKAIRGTGGGGKAKGDGPGGG